MIRKATVKDLPQINELMGFYHLMDVPEDMLKDVCLVSTRGEKIVGFIWGSVSRSRYLAYVDYLTVSPEAKGDAFRLCKKILAHFHKLKVKRIMTLVVEDGSDFSKQALRVNEKIDLVPHETLYRFFIGDAERMALKWVR